MSLLPVNRAMQGFTLMEMVIIIVLVAGGATAIFSLYSQSGRALSASEAVTGAVQQARGCAEFVLARARRAGYAAVTTAGNTICDVLPASAGLVTSVVMSALTPGTGACPVEAAACTHAAVSVSAGVQRLAEADVVVLQ